MQKDTRKRVHADDQTLQGDGLADIIKDERPGSRQSLDAHHPEITEERKIAALDA